MSEKVELPQWPRLRQFRTKSWVSASVEHGEHGGVILAGTPMAWNYPPDPSFGILAFPVPLYIIKLHYLGLHKFRNG